jgi:kinesin family member 11
LKVSNVLHCIIFNRPLNSSEKKSGAYSVVDMCPERREVSIKERGLPTAPVKTFSYDRVFPGSSKQIEIYKTVVVPILEEVLMGYNCTVFA